jgi:hypothetical protein
MVRPNIFSGECATAEAYEGHFRLHDRLRRSKRIQTLLKAVKSIPFLGNWDIMLSGYRNGQFAIIGDGLPLLYLKPQRGLFWYTVTEIRGTEYPFQTEFLIGEKVSLHQLIGVLKIRVS